MLRSIEKNDFTGLKVASFGTSGGGVGLEVDLMASAFRQKGANVLGSYHCKARPFCCSARAIRTRLI